jgi:uncharacterized repeat protein (TIGR01451 family)
MKRFFIAMLAGAVLATSSLQAALAQPNVALKLNGYVVQHGADGDKLVPVERAQLKPGDVIKYVIVASNAGGEAARNLATVGRVPAGTSFYGAPATAGAARAEYSLDGGKTWSAVPMVKAHTASGDVLAKADPATYTAVRWVESKPLAPKSSVAFAYEVRVR